MPLENWRRLLSTSQTMINPTVLAEQHKLARICALMSEHGVRVDPPRIQQVREDIAADRLQITDKYELNLRSHVQLKKFFLDKYSIQLPDTSKDTFLKMAEAHDHIPEFRDIYEYKKIGKGVDAWYGEKYVVGDEIHARWNVTGTVERRLSCSKPNLQNIPHRDSVFAERMRSVIVPRPGCALVEIDFSAGEDWSTAFAAKDSILLDMLRTGVDPHIKTATYVYGDIWCYQDGIAVKCKCHKWEREVGKRMNHMHKYGQGFYYVPKNDLKKVFTMRKRLDKGEAIPGWEGDGYYTYWGTTRMAQIISEFTPDKSRHVLAKVKELALSAKRLMLTDSYRGIAEWQQRTFEEWLSSGRFRNPYGFERPIYGEPETCAKRGWAFIGASTLQTPVIRGMIDAYEEHGHIFAAQIHDSALSDNIPHADAESAGQQYKAILERDRDGLAIPCDVKIAHERWSELK